MSTTPEVRYWQHVESGHVNMARLGGGPDGVAERDPIWREVTVSPVVPHGTATPASATWYTDPPPGWSTFGAHAFMDEVPALEFWGEEYGGDGLPIWERPVPAPDADVALMRRAAASERAAERHWPADMLAQAADTIERLRTDLAANPDADVAERIADAWDDGFAACYRYERGMLIDPANPYRSHATPPAAATKAVSGYTSHGHRITGVVQTGRPASVARCGGPGVCTVCSREAAATGEGADRG